MTAGVCFCWAMALGGDSSDEMCQLSDIVMNVLENQRPRAVCMESQTKNTERGHLGTGVEAVVTDGSGVRFAGRPGVRAASFEECGFVGSP